MTVILAEQLFKEICIRMSHFVALLSYVEVGKTAVHRISPDREKHYADQYNDIVQEFFKVEEGDWTEKRADFLGEVIKHKVSEEVVNFEKTVNASAIVFAHSILDGIAIDLCRVCRLFDPDKFDRYIAKKKVEVGTIKDSSYASIRDTAVSSFLKKLAKESLLKKSDVLHEVCRPKQRTPVLEGYKYDRDRLKRIDETRHQAIHGVSDFPDIPDIASETIYLAHTALYLIDVVQALCNFHITDKQLFSLKARR